MMSHGMAWMIKLFGRRCSVCGKRRTRLVKRRHSTKWRCLDCAEKEKKA